VISGDVNRQAAEASAAAMATGALKEERFMVPYKMEVVEKGFTDTGVGGGENDCAISHRSSEYAVVGSDIKMERASKGKQSEKWSRGDNSVRAFTTSAAQLRAVDTHRLPCPRSAQVGTRPWFLV